jgi:dTDP-glucose pyrophosphorylase
MAGPQLVVMAAGIGSRYGGLKQMDPIGPSGEIVLDYAVYDALKAGFEKVIFVISRRIEETFRERIGKTIEKHTDTAYVFQELDDLPEGYTLPPDRTKPWGTAHAALCAADAVTAPFAAINADDFYGRKSFQILGEYLAAAEDKGGSYDYCMVGFVLANTLTPHGHVARGVCTVGDDGYLGTIVERTKIQQFDDAAKYTEDGEEWVEIDRMSTVSMNMWGFTLSFLTELEQRFGAFLDENIHTAKGEYFVPTVVNELITEGKARVKVLPTDEKWFGVTYKPDKEAATRAITQKVNQGTYPEKLWG